MNVTNQKIEIAHYFIRLTILKSMEHLQWDSFIFLSGHFDSHLHAKYLIGTKQPVTCFTIMCRFCLLTFSDASGKKTPKNKQTKQTNKQKHCLSLKMLVVPQTVNWEIRCLQNDYFIEVF